ncbi:MAG TPA: serine hydroxymethyltransferase [Gemmatimonadota bacterium]|nr:serine hydroxymethyltransferase [Gemmatimonadota bacterium]
MRSARNVRPVKFLHETDPEILKVLIAEAERQADGLELIASENFVSPAVLEAMGSVLTNKYAEGLPGKRYYGGCEVVDVAENLAIERVLSLFGAEHANVQAHSGSQANMAAYLALMEPGDTLLGMDLSAGGHLTHGSPVNFSGRLFRVASYGVGRESGLIETEDVRRVAEECRPKVIVAGGSAYSRTIDFGAFREIADQVGASLVVDMAHFAGLVAGGAFPSPVPYADIVTSTTHKTLRGPRGGLVLCREAYARAVDKMIFPGIQGGPLMHVIAAKAVSFREALEPSFREYAHQVVRNARALADALMERGYMVVSGGTDSHLFLVDLRGGRDAAETTGKQAEAALGGAGITVNKNTVPGETRSPFVTSGIRVGTPALTTRGMAEAEMERIGGWMGDVLDAPEDHAVQGRVRDSVRELCAEFPLYDEWLERRRALASA